MKLVYIWVENFRGMRNIDLNFYHKFKFEFNGKSDLTYTQLTDNEFIDYYYPHNQYYNIIVGKNGSGKSSIIDLLYKGVDERTNPQSGETTIQDRFFAIFFDEKNDDFNFYGVQVDNNNIKVGINKVILKDEYFDNVSLFLLDIRNSSNIYKNLSSSNDVFEKKYLISDDTKKNECLNSVLNRLENSFSQKDIKYPDDIVYRNTQNSLDNLFIKKFLLNYKFYEQLQDQDKDIQLPKYFYIKLNFPSKDYYKNIFKDIKDTYTEIYDAILILYNYIVDNDNLDFLEKIKIFYFIYMCEKFLYFSAEKSIFINTLERISFVDIINKLKQDSINLFVEEIFKNIYTSTILFNPFDEFEILNDFIKGIKSLKYTQENNCLIFELDKQDSYIKNIIGNIFSYEQIFNIGQSYIEFDFDPVLSSGHKQIFKIFNYILEGINSLKSEMDSYSKNILLVLDEPDLNLHYEWQRNFIKWLSLFLSKFKDINFHIIIATHSVFMLSDIPKENIIALDKKEKKVTVKKLKNSTLAQNLFVLLNDDFYIESFLGSYITDKLKEVLRKSKINKKDMQLIDNIGEEIIKKSLKNKLEGK